MSATFSSTSYSPDNLIAGEFPILSKKVTLLSGQNCVRGTVLGKITKGTATAAAKTGGNAANTGAITMDSTTPVLAGAKSGVYTARCIAAASNGGEFEVKDPDGFSLGTVLVGATFSNDIKFVIADGSQDFIVGEGFDITVAAGSGKYKASLAAAVDGSETPDAILAEAADATSADVEALVYVTGGFNSSALTIGTGHTAASITEGLRQKGIHVITTLAN